MKLRPRFSLAQVVELRAALAERGLDDKGLKPALAARLLAAVAP